ncbi:imidazole glycerol phosphate synthase, glutamine amidotransferase subunit [Candidatus Gottesmanbacteria bacterium RIFCSPHIGHO2_02_FULL_40_13]|uniref:Imidazole glycerol phosphate synthase subunit HisH n=1 Tax=Candidatus Gottesmanbacteria bacterium RIFCSPHIGHO2_02_FULL_40_13 TaxID=1798384 RepID=A0A1F6A600_9BACT|nr:MAG: imidazole glycerol phosphate synthase, glutamine amidotransferase subunit [Candidatus Gottesmanbacteria bacterium RIFCSPHIGHO2_02_FULL_40_13]
MIAVIDYGIGNLASITNALNRLNIPAVISRSISTIEKADCLILPGVGAAGEGMRNLQKSGLDKVIKKEIIKGKKFLGICLGMQLLFERSEEGNVECLGLLKGRVKKFKRERKVPQIGWNQVRIKNAELGIKNKLFNKISDKSYFYFVNSFYCTPEDKSLIVGETEYGEKFASVIIKNNIIATQFHPEKSGILGIKLLNNIIKYFSLHSL